MNAVAEQTDLGSLIRNASPQSRRLAMQSLIGEFLEDTKYLPQPILNAAGETIGVFIPQYRVKPAAPPQLTPEQEEELERRLRTPEDSVSAKEFIKLLELEDARLSQPQ